MPILIVLKDPRINLFAEGKIDEIQTKQWDEIFNNQILIFKSRTGRMTAVPLDQGCNIAVMEQMTDKEVEEQEKRSEELRKKREAQGGRGGGPGDGGGLITKPHFGFPAGGRRRR